MFKFLSKLFDTNEKQISKYWPLVNQVTAQEPYFQKLTDEQLRSKTADFRKQLGIDIEQTRKPRDPFLPSQDETDKKLQNKKEAETLYSLIPEVYPLVREASWRNVAHRHFDVQVLCAIFLARGFVTEHFTGEGKSLVAIMPLYLYALMGKTAHLVTVNDYLAKRDGEWAGHVFNALGMSVGVVTQGATYKFIDDEQVVKLKGEDGKKGIESRKKVIKDAGRLLMSSMKGNSLIQCEKKEAYSCDIIYGTNNEFGFDYLRDNMAKNLSHRVQSPLYYAIVDECDSILIDEARTPLIISSPAQESNEQYKKFASLVRNLKINDHYIVDEKAHSVSLTDEGVDKVEKLLNVDNLWEDYEAVHHLDNALKARELYKRDDRYIIRDGQVMIVDEFTGRALAGRRYSEGLHQAIEAKEGVDIRRESRTHATITFQNYFRLYNFLSGMTGTALTESEEFADIYNLEVVVIPTNVPVVRQDSPDVVYRTKQGKFNAVVEEIKELYEQGRPVLVGTTSVENSEELSDMLTKQGVKHNVLNAKHHQKEAMIVADAGNKAQVTIATNMAGRGTDIALGDGVVELGGLHIIGTERHESRRIDNQLRGRSGRQGDAGSSRFYVSFEDDLMRLFGGSTMGNIMSKVGMDDNMPIEAGIIGRTIETAQKKVESYHFDTRKHLVEYDDVLNQQREIIYDMRRKILTILAAATDEKESAKNDYDFKTLDSDFETLLGDLMKISLNNSDSWKISAWKNHEYLSRPLRVWILKMTLQHIDFVISSQVKDDARIDDQEERKVLAAFLDIIPLELAQVSVKKLGYDNWESFSKDFYEDSNPQKQKTMLEKIVLAAYILHIHAMGDKTVSNVERILILQTLDNLWMEHLDLMTDLRHGIGLRGYAQKNPLVEYKNEGFKMFDKMLAQIEDNIVRRFYKVKVVRRTAAKSVAQVQASKAQPSGVDRRPGKISKPKTLVKAKKVGRNDPCPCGSGKKYKKCCGR
ncbi:MAG: SEC-C metal-binding domain-containing protein [Patescibacteria group bacterium]|nr:SEC-C metal-binding domain-containing protein [Patescibacteria group bacterium]